MNTPHLKEIGNRIANLSYREMKELSSKIGDSLAQVGQAVSEQSIVDALLAFSDEVAKADAGKPASLFTKRGDEDFGTRRTR